MTSFAVRHISSSKPISAGRLSDNMARIFNIQRYSLNDGGGIRTVVFFKGCPHTCPWCANPESMSSRIHTVRREAKCLHCQPCLNNADECPATAMERIGRDISLENLLKEVLKDDVFFRTSGGGVTLSGGEVLMQAPFALQFLTRLKELGINTAIETAGDANEEMLLKVAQRCDLVLFDLKIMDTEQAKKCAEYASATGFKKLRSPYCSRNTSDTACTTHSRLHAGAQQFSCNSRLLGSVQSAGNTFIAFPSVWRV